MTDSHRSRNFLLLIVIALLAASFAGCLGCQAGPEPAADALRREFGEQSARVLDGDAAFVATERGFVLPAQSHGLRAALPKKGAEAILFEADGLSVSVREGGAGGDGELAG